MNAEQIRAAYLKFFEDKDHAIIPRSLLVPQNDPTTLFTGSGMQPLISYLLGEPHPAGERLVDSQPCLRAQDIEEVGDNRHTTFFEMLGNWSLGSYFKAEQLPWFFEFLTDIVGLNPDKLFVTCFIGDSDYDIAKDSDSAQIWEKLFASKDIEAKQVEIGSEENGYKVGMNGGRIFYYDASKNWWCRAGKISLMPTGEPGGPDSEVFYRFYERDHNEQEKRKYGEFCHPNCDCGQFLEIGNSVFMEYLKTDQGFTKLPKQNVDFGGGLERIAAAALSDGDVFRVSILWPIVAKLQDLSGKDYDNYTQSMRVIADHLRAATFLAVDGIVPSNKEQGYVMRRLLRRAIRFAFELGVEQNLCSEIVPIITALYQDSYPEINDAKDRIIDVLVREEKIFRQTLRKGLAVFSATLASGKNVSGEDIFKLYDTYGFPAELSKEEAYKHDVAIDGNADSEFERLMDKQRDRSRTATKGEFKGGLGGQTLQHKKYHTATHLMYEALRQTLGDHVIQHGSNINEERLRFDFSHPDKMTPEQIKQVEDIVNQQIERDLKVSFEEHPTSEAINDLHVLGAFGDRYGDVVKVYRMQADNDKEPFSLEICGGPHVDRTGQLAEDNKKFKIIKEESSSAGIRRIKAVLQ
jgi:alanyl-tRNA synthetase